MSEEGDLTITPFFDDPVKDIHPAIGTVDGVAYIGVWVPCMVTDKEGHSKNRDMLYLITSKREKILCTEQELAKHGWRLAYKPIHFTNRWELSDVQAYVKGSTVDVQKLFTDIVADYKEFTEMPDDGFFNFHALWTAGTYFHVLFNTYPYPYIGGVKRSGKTKIETVHFTFDFNAVFSNNMSVSSLYRMIQNSHATLLIDETEKLSNPNRAQEFRNILLSGYKKGCKTFRVEKSAKDRLEPEEFEVYSPKMLANIGGLEDVLEDRCITQFQRRSLNKKILNREIDIMDPRYTKFRDNLYKLFLCHWQEVKEIYAEISKCSELCELCVCVKTNFDSLPEGSKYLSSRELELWKPIFALAAFFDSVSTATAEKELVFTRSQHSLSSLMLDLACSLAAQRHTQNLTEVGEEILVQCLLQVVPKEQEECWVKVKQIKEAMSAQFEETQEWLTTKWIGSALRRLGFSDKKRMGTGYMYNIPSKTIEELKERMQIEELPKPEESEKPTIQEILESVRTNLGSVFAEEKMLAEIMQLGFSREEAQKRVDHFKVKELIVKDNIGGWHFV